MCQPEVFGCLLVCDGLEDLLEFFRSFILGSWIANSILIDQ